LKRLNLTNYVNIIYQIKTDLFVNIELINKTVQLKSVTYFYTTNGHQKLDNIKRYNDKIRSIWNLY